LTVEEALLRAKKATKQGNTAVAMKLYRAILKYQPDHLFAKNQLCKLPKKSTQNKPPEAETSNPPQDQITALVNLYNSGQMTETEQACRELLQAYPQSLVVMQVLGVALNDQSKLEESIQVFNKTIQLRADFTSAYYNRGNALRRLGRLDEAMRDFDKAIQLRPDYTLAHNNRGVTLKQLGQLKDALESCDKAIQLKPDFAEAQYNHHSLLLNHLDLMPAIKCMEKAINIDPFNLNYKFILGMLWDYSGDTQKATPHFDTVESGDGLCRARLDAWRHIKSVNKKVPVIIGSSIDAFKLGIEAAVVEGLVLEFGVRFGTSIRQISALVDQDVHGFDSFQGLPESWHNEAKGSYSTKGVIPSVPQNVILHNGWFEETLPRFVEQHPEPVCFMNIDCDIYSSTKTILENFAKQIVPGTVIIFDEYIGNEHWREDEFKAFQEAAFKYGWKYEYLCFSFVTKQVVVLIH
jgi:tetratricopeptide (TPR) repeat protein